MFQIPPHDAHDPHIIRIARNSRKYAADAPHDQVDPHSRLRRLGSFTDKIHICQGIHLHDDPAVLPLPDLFIHKMQYFLLQPRRGDDQMLVNARQVTDGHIFEKFRRIPSDLLICCHQRQIRIHSRRLLIIISRSDLRNVLDLIPVPVSDQAHFGMHFVPFYPVDHPASGLLQPLRPLDIVLLVKSGPKLDQHRDFLSILRRRAQVLYQPRFLGQPIDRNLDRHNARVNGSFFNHLKKRVHALIWIEQKDILFLHLPHHAPLRHPGGILRQERRICKRPLHRLRQLAAYREHIAQLHGHLCTEDLVRIDLELIAEKLLIARRELFRRLKTDDRHLPPLVQSLLHQMSKIVVDLQRLVVGRHVPVPRHADIIWLRHFILWEDEA